MLQDWGRVLVAFDGKKFLAPNRLHLLGFAALIPRRLLGRAFLTLAHPLFGTSLAFPPVHGEVARLSGGFPSTQEKSSGVGKEQ